MLFSRQNHKIYKTIALVFTFMFFLAPPVALADTSGTVTITPPSLGVQIPGLNFATIIIAPGKTATIPYLAQYISAGYKYLIGIGVIAAIIMVTYGGFRYLIGSAMGDVKRGKEIVKDAIFGLIILLGAYLILQTVNPRLVQLKGITPAGVSADDYVAYTDKETELQGFGGGGGGGGGGIGAGGAAPSGGGGQQVSQSLSGIFQAYSACYGFDWHILTAIGTIESNLNTNDETTSGKYQGIFQFDKNGCLDNTQTYPGSLTLNCDNLKDPETNTAAMAYRVSHLLNIIKNGCGSQNITAEEQMRLLYTGHNNGPAVMRYVISHGGCHLQDQLTQVRAYSSAYPDYGKKVDADRAQRKWEYGDKAVQILKADGVTDLFPANGINDNICPIITGNRAVPAS